MTSKMANKMLEEDFKSTHPDLVKYGDDNKHEENDADQTSLTLKDSSGPKRSKSVDFAIQAPPKRARPTKNWTPKQVVDGKLLCPELSPFFSYVTHQSNACHQRTFYA